MFKEFEVYCNKLITAEGQGGGTSISRSTGQKIMEFLTSQPAHEVPKKFKHFVQKHEFRVREDILCVPAKSREVRNHACHAVVAYFLLPKIQGKYSQENEECVVENVLYI
jgi:hypothetical protein